MPPRNSRRADCVPRDRGHGVSRRSTASFAVCRVLSRLSAPRRALRGQDRHADAATDGTAKAPRGRRQHLRVIARIRRESSSSSRVRRTGESCQRRPDGRCLQQFGIRHLAVMEHLYADWVRSRVSLFDDLIAPQSRLRSLDGRVRDRGQGAPEAIADRRDLRPSSARRSTGTYPRSQIAARVLGVARADLQRFNWASRRAARLRLRVRRPGRPAGPGSRVSFGCRRGSRSRRIGSS